MEDDLAITEVSICDWLPIPFANGTRADTGLWSMSKIAGTDVTGTPAKAQQSTAVCWPRDV